MPRFALFVSGDLMIKGTAVPTPNQAGNWTFSTTLNDGTKREFIVPGEYLRMEKE